MFLKSGFVIRRLASLHRLQSGAVRRLRRYYQDAMTSSRPSRRTSLPSFGGTSAALALSLPSGQVRRCGLELVTRELQPGCCRGGERISQVPGESPLSVCTCSNDAGRTVDTRPLRCTARPLLRVRQGLPQLVFRRSIAWLSDWLSTLRSADYSNPTQDSLPAAGQALPDGLPTRKIPLKGFKVVSLHLFLLSQASWHKHALMGSKDDGP